MARGLTHLIFFTLFAILTASSLSAQTGNGVVQGTVLDSTRAAIPGASVVLKNTATGVSRTAQTSGVGVYYFGSVPIGPYTLAIVASGFKKWEGTLTVDTGQTVTIDPTMEVGSVESTVEVTGAAPVISTEGMQVSDIKDALRIHQLPLNGRLVTNLFNLTPGVENAGNPRTNGMKVGSTEMLLDGISLVGRNSGGMTPVQPGLDTVQEFRIETAGSGAQYSRPATVTLATRSGTNIFHGSVFETHRNNFGGLRTRRREDGNTAAKLIRNEFGVAAGGPIIKNKTFWFASYEGLRQREAQFAQAAVPTPAIWDGDFSNAITQNNEKITIYDPFTTGADGSRLPFAGNKIPKNLITPFAQTMRSVSPDPAGPNAGGNPWIEPNFTAYYPNTTDSNTMTVRGDHVFSEKDNISGRITRSWLMNKLFGGQYGYPKLGLMDAGGTALHDYKDSSALVRWNHVFSPTLLNEFQASVHRSPIHFGTLADETNWADKLGLPNPFGAKGWPTICADAPFLYWGCWDADNRNDHNMTAFQIDDNVTWVKGTHTLKFGFKGRQELNNYRMLQQTQGSHSFYSDWTALYDPVGNQFTSFTGSGFASMLLGLPTYLSNQYNRGYFYFRQKELGLYFQDTWKLTQRLTLTLGLRWDYWPPYSEKYDRLVNLDLRDYAGKMQVITPQNVQMEQMPGVPSSVLESWKVRGLTWVTADSIGFPGSLVPSVNKNFGPRFGAAYRLTDKWVLRAGFGMYYWPMPLAQILASSTGNPPLNLRFVNSISDLNGTRDYYALTNSPAPNDSVGKARVDVNGIVPISLRARAFMPWDIDHWADDQAREWTFTLEREVMRNTALRLTYIGNQGRNLEQRWRWNDPESEWNYQARTGLAANSANPDPRRVNPNWTAGCCNAAMEHNGYSNSHSLQAEIERRYSNGLAFQWFYTFAHAMTTNDTGASWGHSSINSSGSGGDNLSSATAAAFAVPENQVIPGQPNLTRDQRLRFGYANSDSVPAQRIRWNGIYDLPFGRGRKFGGSSSRAVDAVVGGWQVAFIGEWRSGMWMGVTSNKYLFGDPTLTDSQRPDMNIFGRRQRLWFRGDFDPTFASDVDQTKLQRLVPVDRSQRILRPLGTNFDNRLPQMLANGTIRETPIGDMLNWNARNFYRGPGFWNEDLSIFKNFQITERVRTRFTADFFTFFNHPNDVDPDQSTGLQNLSVQNNEPRIIQLSLRVEW